MFIQSHCVNEAAVKHGERRKLKIMISQRIPFAFNPNDNGVSGLRGLDILLLDSFAKQYNLHIEYVTFNISLTEIFESEELMETFLNTSEIKWVLV